MECVGHCWGGGEVSCFHSLALRFEILCITVGDKCIINLKPLWSWKNLFFIKMCICNMIRINTNESSPLQQNTAKNLKIYLYVVVGFSFVGIQKPHLGLELQELKMWRIHLIKWSGRIRSISVPTFYKFISIWCNFQRGWGGIMSHRLSHIHMK